MEIWDLPHRRITDYLNLLHFAWICSSRMSSSLSSIRKSEFFCLGNWGLGQISFVTERREKNHMNSLSSMYTLQMEHWKPNKKKSTSPLQFHLTNDLFMTLYLQLWVLKILVSYLSLKKKMITMVVLLKNIQSWVWPSNRYVPLGDCYVNLESRSLKWLQLLLIKYEICKVFNFYLQVPKGIILLDCHWSFNEFTLRHSVRNVLNFLECNT